MSNLNFSAAGAISLAAFATVNLNLTGAAMAQNGVDQLLYNDLAKAVRAEQRVVQLAPYMLQLPLVIQPGGAAMSPVLPSFDLPRQFVAVTSTQAGALVLS